MSRKIHEFDNGVKVYDDQLLEIQRKRYAKRNVHEAEEEDIFIKLISSIPVEGCFVNIGSAIGYYPILAKKLSPYIRVYAFEPLRRHRDIMIENIKLNGLKLECISLQSEAISELDGTVELVDKGYGSRVRKGKSYKAQLKKITKSLIKPFNKTESEVEKVRSVSLDSLVQEFVKGTIDLVQMDIQGHEIDVLRGGIKALKSNMIKAVLVGTHGWEIHNKCIHILKECGYQIEYENHDTQEQPDGIIVASKGATML